MAERIQDTKRDYDGADEQSVKGGCDTQAERTLVIGDMHCKEEPILERVDAAIEQLGCGRIVFCGDYVDEWHSNLLTMRDALDALRTWVLKRRADGLTVDLVTGNHDMQYRLRETGPGTHAPLFDEVAHLLDELNVRAATTVGNTLVTHAGVTRSWATDCLDLAEGTDAQTIARQLNSLLDHGQKISLRMLAMAGAARGGYELPGPSGRPLRNSRTTRFRDSTKSSGTRRWNPSTCGTSRPKTASAPERDSCSATHSA